jgi:hypothetical protein
LSINLSLSLSLSPVLAVWEKYAKGIKVLHYGLHVVPAADIRGAGAAGTSNTGCICSEHGKEQRQNVFAGASRTVVNLTGTVVNKRVHDG